MSKGTCSVDGCLEPRRARGYCEAHYAKARLAGEFEPKRCSVEDCERPHYGRGLCNMHWQREYKRNPDKGVLRKPRGVCSVDGCERLHTARGYCATHLARVNRTGEAGEAELRVYAGAGEGWIDASGYRRFSVNSRHVLEHRQVMEQYLGRPLRQDETVHHINGDRLDNRLENLQLRTGRHGKGVAHECLDCGSFNVVAVPLEGESTT